MRLWSIQHPAVWDRLKASGVFRAEAARCDKGYRRPYAWMARQMVQRGVQGRPGVLIWAWMRSGDLPSGMPDLRTGGHLPRGAPGVRLELQIDDNRVLLSQFEMWHAVLNRHPVQLADADLPEEWPRRMMEKSWEHIFDLNAGSEAGWGPRSGRAIQGCLFELRLEDVRAAKHFRAR